MIVATIKDIIVPNISRRFGKSTTCVVYTMEEAINKKQDIRYATAFLTDLQGFIIPIFDEVLATCPDSLRPTYHKSNKVYTFPNGSTIKLVGLDKNPNGIRGNAIDILVIDEAAFVSNLKQLYLSIIVPATMERDFKIMFPSTPPEDSEHYWLELVAKAKDRKTYLELTIDDNTSLSPKEKKRVLDEIGGIDSPEARREFFCEIIRDPKTTIVPEFDAKKSVVAFERPSHYKPQTALDFGGSVDKTGIITAYYDFNRAIYCVVASKLIDNNTGTTQIIKHANDTEAWILEGVPLDRPVYCTGQTRVDLGLAEFHTRVPEKSKGSMEAHVNQLRLAFQQGKIEIYPENNDDLIKTLELGQWNKTGTDFKRTDALGHADMIAALAYGYHQKLTGNPFPDFFGRSMDIAHHTYKDKKNENFLLDHLYEDIEATDWD